MNADDMTLDIGSLLRRLWSRKKLVLGITSGFIVLGLILVLVLPSSYKAEAVLAPVAPTGMDGMGGAIGQYSGILSSIGINAGGSGVKKSDMGLEILRSRKFVAEFITRHDILPALMAAKRWDAETNELILDEGAYDVAAKSWLDGTPPTAHDAYEEFSDILSVSEDKVSGFVRIGLVHKSPTVAKDWVDWLISDLNTTIMKQDVREAEQAIDYLKRQAENTPLAGLQNVFFRLIEEQTKTVMLAQAKTEYLFKTVDPAVVPQDRFSPRRLVILFAAFAFGFLTSVVVILFLRPGNHRSDP